MVHRPHGTLQALQALSLMAYRKTRSNNIIIRSMTYRYWTADVLAFVFDRFVYVIMDTIGPLSSSIKHACPGFTFQFLILTVIRTSLSNMTSTHYIDAPNEKGRNLLFIIFQFIRLSC